MSFKDQPTKYNQLMTLYKDLLHKKVKIKTDNFFVFTRIHDIARVCTYAIKHCDISNYQLVVQMS